MLTGTNLKHAKAHNVRIVLETIRLFGPVARGEIARRTELTTQTVSNLTRQLLKAGLILEADRIQEGRGAPSTLFKLNPEGAFSIGLDLDKDHMTGVLVDFVGNVRQRIADELHFPSPEEALDLLEATALQLIAQEGLRRQQIWGVGVGLPGPLKVSEGSLVTNMVNPSAFPGWADVTVVDVLSEKLALPVFLENNATAAAVGEHWYGGGRHIRSFFYVYFGAGLGGGLVIKGQPFEGSTGNAGELGLFPVAADAYAVGDFQRPHLGIYFNLPRLYQKLSEAGFSVSRADELMPLFDAKNEALLDWLDTGVTHLAPLILAIEYLIDPEAIIFGGRLPDPLIKDLLERLEALLPTLRTDGKAASPQLCCASAGADAAALGVATLPLYASFSPTPGLLMKWSNGEDGTVLSTAHRNKSPLEVS